jgi:two-component system response regulator FlrC
MSGRQAILVVEDDPVQMRQVARLLRSEGYCISQATSGSQAIRKLEEHGADLVLTDRRMPTLDGDSLLGYIRLNFPGMPVAMITAYPEGVESLKLDGLLEKPFRGEQLLRLVRCLLKKLKN